MGPPLTAARPGRQRRRPPDHVRRGRHLRRRPVSIGAHEEHGAGQGDDASPCRRRPHGSGRARGRLEPERDALRRRKVINNVNARGRRSWHALSVARRRVLPPSALDDPVAHPLVEHEPRDRAQPSPAAIGARCARPHEGQTPGGRTIRRLARREATPWRARVTDLRFRRPGPERRRAEVRILSGASRKALLPVTRWCSPSARGRGSRHQKPRAS
jgi:hypothetical protein